MQETVQGTRNYIISNKFNEKQANEIGRNSGSASVAGAGTNLRFFAHWQPKGFFYLSCDDCAFIGGAFQKKHFRLVEFCVKKDCQKQGYGKFLLNELEKECYKRKVSKITLRTSRTEDARSWYERHGFQVVGIINNDWEMEKIL